MAKITKPDFLGSSRDQRANVWMVTCPACGKQWKPLTTMLATQGLDCPARKCGARMVADYNAETVTLINTSQESSSAQ